MDPMTMMMLANAGVQIGAPLFDQYFGGAQTEQINPYTGQQWGNLNQAYADAMAQYQAQLDQTQQIQGDIRGTERDVAGVTQDISQVQQPGAMDWYDNFLTTVPGYEQIASNLAQRATTDLGRSIDEQVQMDTQRAMTEAMNQFAGQGAYSGAAQAALGQAVAQPMAAGRTQLTGQKAGIEAGAFGQLAGQGQQLAAQGTQSEFQNAMAALNEQLRGYGQIGGLQQGRAGTAMQGAGLASQLAAQTQAQRTGMADPIFETAQGPQYGAAAAAGMGSAFNLMTNPQYGMFQPSMGANPFAPAAQPNYANSYYNYNQYNPTPLTGR